MPTATLKEYYTALQVRQQLLALPNNVVPKVELMELRLISCTGDHQPSQLCLPLALTLPLYPNFKIWI